MCAVSDTAADVTPCVVCPERRPLTGPVRRAACRPDVDVLALAVSVSHSFESGGHMSYTYAVVGAGRQGIAAAYDLVDVRRRLARGVHRPASAAAARGRRDDQSPRRAHRRRRRPRLMRAIPSRLRDAVHWLPRHPQRGALRRQPRASPNWPISAGAAHGGPRRSHRRRAAAAGRDGGDARGASPLCPTAGWGRASTCRWRRTPMRSSTVRAKSGSGTAGCPRIRSRRGTTCRRSR